MEALGIEKTLFLIAFERDVDYEEPPQAAYLDLASGGIDWVFEEDEAVELFGVSAAGNETQRKRVSSNPERFLLIPGLSHADHHDILKSFLASNWTSDGRQRRIAQDAYTGSIGRWKNVVARQDIIQAYQKFRDRRTAELAEAFLMENNVKVKWR